MSGHHFTRVHIPAKKVVAITAPSGAGKSTVVKKLLQHRTDLAFSVSCTTREKRTGEEHGREYYFITVEDFKKKIAAGEFAEYEEVYPNQFYGTLKSEVERIWASHKVVLFDIDVKGAVNIKKQYGSDCLSIFIEPPSKESLINRLKGRNSEDSSSLKKRIKRAEEELSYADKFDKRYVNSDFDTCYMRVKNALINFLKPAEISVHA